MALEKATTYKSFPVPNGYTKITGVNYSPSGTNEDGGKTYIVQVFVGTFKDGSKTQLLAADRHVFTMVESEINLANMYAELKKMSKYFESLDV